MVSSGNSGSCLGLLHLVTGNGESRKAPRPPGPQRRKDGLGSVGFTEQELKTLVSQKIP